MKKLKLTKIDNFFFSYQKIPFKWFEISVGGYIISDDLRKIILEKLRIEVQEELYIVVQITKLRFHFKYFQQK